jgi:predicted dienelactone hydrolase
MIFGPDGVKNISVPMLIMGGSGDTIVPPEWNSFYDNVSSAKKAMVVFDHADHLIFGPNCAAVPWLVDLGGFAACSDAVWDIDRVHDLTDHFITAFLLSTFYDDANAAAALAPDAVNFPGIAYEEQGF